MEREIVNAIILVALAVTAFTAGYRIRNNPDDQWMLFVRFLTGNGVYEEQLYEKHSFYGGKKQHGGDSFDAILKEDALNRIRKNESES